MFLLETPRARRRSAVYAPAGLVLMNLVEDELSSLKDHMGAYIDGHDVDGCAEACELEREARRTAEQKIRKCMICRDAFPSAWAGERVCRKCKSTSTWRSSGME
jgi:hypothetical protein